MNEGLIKTLGCILLIILGIRVDWYFGCLVWVGYLNRKYNIAGVVIYWTIGQVLFWFCFYSISWAGVIKIVKTRNKTFKLAFVFLSGLLIFLFTIPFLF